MITYKRCLRENDYFDDDIEWTIFPKGNKIKTKDEIRLYLSNYEKNNYIRVVAKSNCGFTIFQPILLTNEFVPLRLPINRPFPEVKNRK